MELHQLLAHITRVIETLQLPYLITGSYAAMFYGEPRFTNDIDVVVQLSEEQAKELCHAFPEDDFYVSATAAISATRNKSQFNIIHPASGLKIDVIVADASPFNHSRFARARRLHAAPSIETNFASPEDVIIKKIEYYREGGSEKHLRDIAGVLKISDSKIDYAYIDRWTREMGTNDIWQSILSSIGAS